MKKKLCHFSDIPKFLLLVPPRSPVHTMSSSTKITEVSSSWWRTKMLSVNKALVPIKSIYFIYNFGKEQSVVCRD